MSDDSGCDRPRVTQHSDMAAIEEAMKLLDDLRDDLDAAISDGNEPAAKVLLSEIKALVATLDEMIAEQKG